MIDALIIALSSQSILQKASILSWQNKVLKKEEIFGKLHPWKTLENEFEQKIRDIIISFTPKHKINGALHNETWFWRLEDEAIIKLKKSNDGMVLENGKWIFMKRVPLNESFEVKKVTKIYDKTIRELVRIHLSSYEDNPKLAFPKVWEWKLFHKDWKTPIKSVRIYEKKSLEWIYDYKGEWNLFYETGSNHHVEIIEHTRMTNKDETPIRKGIFVTMLEAATRATKKLPVVQRKWPWKDGEEILEEWEWKFVMSLMIDDMVEIEWKIFRVKQMSWPNDTVLFSKQFSANSEGYDLKKTPNSLKNCTKIQVSPLGIKSIAND